VSLAFCNRASKKASAHSFVSLIAIGTGELISKISWHLSSILSHSLISGKA
jgi:hypothetical protein